MTALPVAEGTRHMPDESMSLGNGLQAIWQLYYEIGAALENAPELHSAFETATDFADALRDMADGAAFMRARIAAQIREAEHLSVAELGGKLGMSKARAAQLIKAAHRG